LRVTAQAKVRIAFDEHLLIDRAVRVVANVQPSRSASCSKTNGRVCSRWHGAQLSSCRAMASPPCRFENVAAVRIVALHTTHAAFNDRMMLRQIEFGLNIQMTLKTGRRVIARIDDECCAAAGFDMFAAGTVAGFAPGLPAMRRTFKMNPRVRAGGKFPDDVGVTIRAGFIADVMRAGNFQRRTRVHGHVVEQEFKNRANDGCAGCGPINETAGRNLMFAFIRMTRVSALQAG
jgi:hypothetical protein